MQTTPLLRRLVGAAALVGVCQLGLALAVPRLADAFCGFYVGGGDAKLYNNATLVVLMRDGTRTVLSMQNNYQGPPQDFALVVPVPVILKEQDVKTLPREIFGRVDQLAAPRLVEYWEQDPCEPQYDRKRMMDGAVPDEESAPVPSSPPKDFGVKIEAQFTVGEYDIVILSAQEATGLDGWLRANKYNIPEGAESVLRPYVQQGMKFFVAKVDVKKVSFDAKGQAMLSPLRFHYDSESFNLPVRLGLLNSAGAQDLLVHILARSRYAVANYPNVTIPTNIEVKDGARDNFGAFYVSLFDATLAQNPKAVVTEYAWQANNCDPCPLEPLGMAELNTFGADVLSPSAVGPKAGVLPNVPDRQYQPHDFVLTRLHARYSKESLGEDLVFEEAPPIVGGREIGGRGQLERGGQPSSNNNFQARYIIRHAWTGKVECKDPQYGTWGGPPSGHAQKPAVARDLAFAPRDASLATYVAEAVPELKLAVDKTPGAAPTVDPVATPPSTTPPSTTPPSTTPPSTTSPPPAKPADNKPAAGCGGCDTSGAGGAGWLVGVLGLGLARRRRAHS